MEKEAPALHKTVPQSPTSPPSPPSRMVPVPEAGHEAEHGGDGSGEGQASQGFGEILTWGRGYLLVTKM